MYTKFETNDAAQTQIDTIVAHWSQGLYSTLEACEEITEVINNCEREIMTIGVDSMPSDLELLGLIRRRSRRLEQFKKTVSIGNLRTAIEIEIFPACAPSGESNGN